MIKENQIYFQMKIYSQPSQTSKMERIAKIVETTKSR